MRGGSDAPQVFLGNLGNADDQDPPITRDEAGMAITKRS